ncbi:hypothetical protein HZ326_10559 [Fusarium oxysporum f. sp. albedinis]|nr:hypothetical protein HZ326_10559 [Fusarium oxysporum f. sp. albedinis]
MAPTPTVSKTGTSTRKAARGCSGGSRMSEYDETKSLMPMRRNRRGESFSGTLPRPCWLFQLLARSDMAPSVSINSSRAQELIMLMTQVASCPCSKLHKKLRQLLS